MFNRSRFNRARFNGPWIVRADIPSGPRPDPSRGTLTSRAPDPSRGTITSSAPDPRRGTLREPS